jgi:hypothetical protein
MNAELFASAEVAEIGGNLHSPMRLSFGFFDSCFFELIRG